MLPLLRHFCGRPSARRQCTHQARLELEVLEDRLVPSTTPLDLSTAGAQGAIGAALFEQGSTQPAGSGVIHSFVRIHAQGGAPQEQGFNTDARPLQFDENSSPTFTRSLALSDVPLVNVNGTDYRVFLLDINQKASAPLVSLDQLQIFVGGSGNLTGYNTSSRQLAGLTAVYDMNPTGNNGNWVELNARLSHGSGSSDMYLLVPDSLFVGTAGDPYVYLYSQFGSHYNTNGGYEEWAVNQVNGPAPSALSGTVESSSSGSTAPLANVMVTLTGTDVNGNQVTLNAVTNANGFFFFDSLLPGTYNITETVPAGASSASANAGSSGGTTSGNSINNIVLNAGLNGAGYNFFDVFAGSGGGGGFGGS